MFVYGFTLVYRFLVTDGHLYDYCTSTRARLRLRSFSTSSASPTTYVASDSHPDLRLDFDETTRSTWLAALLRRSA